MLVSFPIGCFLKIAVFGGSFDPVHIAHKKVVQAALKNLDIDKIIIVPTYLNPLKNIDEEEPENN